MNSEELIKKILIEANSLGFKKELLERVKNIMHAGPKKHYINILKEEFQQILNEITD
jgi:hypothetical protein